MQLLKPRALVVGSNGLLGTNLVSLLKDAYDVYGLDLFRAKDAECPGVEYFEGDLTDKKRIVEIVKSLQPNYIFNAAAYTNVDRSESEREVCWKVNAEGVSYLAYAAKLIHAKMIHVSTDYVFDGKNGPYRETDRPNPLGYYAKSKLAGENLLHSSGADFVIARTIVLYGYSPTAPDNFVTWAVKQLRNGQAIRIVDDQFSNPTLADELAQALRVLAENDASGVYHVSGRDVFDRYTFTQMLAKVFDLDASLISPVKTSEFQQAAPRPLKSGFVTEKFESEFGKIMSSTEEGLLKFKAKYGNALLGGS